MKTKIYTQSEHVREVEKALRGAEKKIRREVIDMMLNLAAWALWDEMQADEDTIKKVLQKMSYKAEYVVDGSVSLDDIKKMLKDEADITIMISGG